MTEQSRSIGERLFEEYLISQGFTHFEFEKVFEARSRKPDYTLYIDREYLFDVKEFEYQATPLWSDPYERIRGKIEEGRKKFKEFKNWPCCLVLRNDSGSLVELEDPDTMLGAMYGDRGIRMAFDPEAGSVVPGSTEEAFLDHGKTIRPHGSTAQNTTLSALITLRFVPIGP